jgi:hypothetical protein
MNSYLVIEDMKLEAISAFRQTWPNKTMWSNMPKYKIRVSATFDQYDKIRTLKCQKDISFTFKRNDGEFFIGYFDLESTLGISKSKESKTIDIHLSKLESEKAPKDFCRDLLLKELLG